VPFARTWRGRISGTYTQGMQFIVMPKESMYCNMSVAVNNQKMVILMSLL
jgi:hypothetical protein